MSFINSDFLLILLKVVVAIIIGGLIGLEREGNKHDAGIRTYALVCLGSAVSMMISQSIASEYSSDISRIGAQVVSGIGFIGAGCILVNGNKIKGLTTAAGLWTTACIGLAIGIGYWTISIISAVFVLITIMVLHPLSTRLQKKNSVCSFTATLNKETGPAVVKEINGKTAEISSIAYENNCVVICGTYCSRDEDELISLFTEKADSFKVKYD